MRACQELIDAAPGVPRRGEAPCSASPRRRAATSRPRGVGVDCLPLAHRALGGRERLDRDWADSSSPSRACSPRFTGWIALSIDLVGRTVALGARDCSARSSRRRASRPCSCSRGAGTSPRSSATILAGITARRGATRSRRASSPTGSTRSTRSPSTACRSRSATGTASASSARSASCSRSASLAEATSVVARALAAGVDGGHGGRPLLHLQPRRLARARARARGRAPRVAAAAAPRRRRARGRGCRRAVGVLIASRSEALTQPPGASSQGAVDDGRRLARRRRRALCRRGARRRRSPRGRAARRVPARRSASRPARLFVVLALVVAGAAFARYGGPVVDGRARLERLRGAAAAGGRRDLNDRLLSFSGNGRVELWRGAADIAPTIRRSAAAPGRSSGSGRSGPTSTSASATRTASTSRRSPSSAPSGSPLLVGALLLPLVGALSCATGAARRRRRGRVRGVPPPRRRRLGLGALGRHARPRCSSAARSSSPPAAPRAAGRHAGSDRARRGGRGRERRRDRRRARLERPRELVQRDGSRRAGRRAGGRRPRATADAVVRPAMDRARRGAARCRRPPRRRRELPRLDRASTSGDWRAWHDLALVTDGARADRGARPRTSALSHEQRDRPDGARSSQAEEPRGRHDRFR